jgi:hypothetical protein
MHKCIFGQSDCQDLLKSIPKNFTLYPTGGREAARGGGAEHEEKQCGSPRRSGVSEVAGRGWRGGVPMALEGGGSPALTLQVGEMMGHVRGGLSGKSEEECVRAGVLTGDGGATAFHEADGGRNGAATWRKEEGGLVEVGAGRRCASRGG